MNWKRDQKNYIIWRSREKFLKTKEQRFKNIKKIHIYAIRVQEKEEKDTRTGKKKSFEEIISENLPNVI